MGQKIWLFPSPSLIPQGLGNPLWQWTANTHLSCCRQSAWLFVSLAERSNKIMISTRRFNNRMHQDLLRDRQDWSASSNWSTCAGVQAMSLVSQKCVSCRAGKPHSSISLSPPPGTTCAQRSICRRRGYSWEPPAPSIGKQSKRKSLLLTSAIGFQDLFMHTFISHCPLHLSSSHSLGFCSYEELQNTWWVWKSKA